MNSDFLGGGQYVALATTLPLRSGQGVLRNCRQVPQSTRALGPKRSAIYFSRSFDGFGKLVTENCFLPVSLHRQLPLLRRHLTPDHLEVPLNPHVVALLPGS